MIILTSLMRNMYFSHSFARPVMFYIDELLFVQVNKKFHKFERVYRDCIKRTIDKTRIHCIPHDAPGT